MRIRTSSEYRHRGNCDVGDDCTRHYCVWHRLLYMTCESTMDYDDLRDWYTGECSLCKSEADMKSYRESRERWEERNLDRAIEAYAFPNK